MTRFLEKALAVAEPALTASNPREASAAFFGAMEPFGATYLQTRLYRRPFEPLTSETHWRAGGFILRASRPGWVGSSAFNFVCFECNPLLTAIQEGRTRYRFSDFAPRQEFGTYWEAMGEAAIHDALCATSYGSGRRIASLHLGFHKRDFSGAEAFAIHLAGLMLTERMMELGDPPDAMPDLLTPRERDCLAFVAEGKTDWEISVILGISQTTAKFHVDNARRKLGAVNRMHAVARFIATGLAQDQMKTRPRNKRPH